MLKTWMNLLPILTLLSGAETGFLSVATASGMIMMQDVLRLLWEVEQKALHLWPPKRHEPIPGCVLAWQGNLITGAQHSDRGFWSEMLLADTRELGEGVHNIDWVRLPPEIREDVDVLRYVAQLWCASINVDWTMRYDTSLPQRGSASAYPLAHNYYPLPGRVMDSVETQPEAEPETYRPCQARPVLSVPFITTHSRGMQCTTSLMELLLGISPIGVDDNFFKLGGYSLLVTQLTSRLEHGFDVHIDLLTLVKNPNPRNIYVYTAAQLGGEDNLEIARQ